MLIPKYCQPAVEVTGWTLLDGFIQKQQIFLLGLSLCHFWHSILPCGSFLRIYIIISVYRAVFSPFLHFGIK